MGGPIFRQHNCSTKTPSPTQSIFTMKFNWVILSTAVFALSILSSHTSFEKLPSKINADERICSDFAGAPRTAQQMAAAGYKRYGVEKGTLVFQYTGAVSGTDYIYFDNWGWREAKYTRSSTKIGSFSEETNAVQYLDGESRYVYDPATNKAKYYDSRQAIVIADQHGTKDMVAFGDVLLKNMGAKPAGKSKVGDIECDVWKIEDKQVKLLMWQGLTMGEESYVNGIMVGRKCTKVELEKNPPLQKLVLPKGVEVGK